MSTEILLRQRCMFMKPQLVTIPFKSLEINIIFKKFVQKFDMKKCMIMVIYLAAYNRQQLQNIFLNIECAVSYQELDIMVKNNSRSALLRFLPGTVKNISYT